MIEEDKKRTTDQPTIERQMLLAQFACAALTGMVFLDRLNTEDAAETAFAYEDKMLAEFERRVKR